ncbi:uncharacterized protein LOC135835616 [Planococcus citri]|uniref:uncharacterized protein LOC135835616 n=1 Tax=Planococcus citri TaxID=170843 RepID=UPI0031F97DC8
MYLFNHASPVMTPEKGSTSSTPSTESLKVLPLTLIDLGGSCINPTKIEADWIKNDEQQNMLGGGTKFSADVEGNLKFMCANTPSAESASTMSSNNQNCTYPAIFGKTDYLACVHEPQPVISELKPVTGPISFISNIRCGQEGRGKMYRYVYKICMSDISTNRLFGFNLFESVKYRSEFEVYRFCFDEQENSVLYTEHRIYSPKLLNEPALGEERKKPFETISRNYEVFGLNTDRKERKFNWTTLPNETQVPSNNDPSSKKFIISKNQKLVPPEDFAFALWRKPTYDRLNSKKMPSERTNLWDHINKLIRDDAIFHNREYYIKTQAFKMTMPHAIINQNETNTPEPHIWMKKVFYFPDLSRPNISYKNKAIVVLMVTESTPQIVSEIEKRCVYNLCQKDHKKSYFYVGNFIYCCSMITNEALREDGVKIDEDLEINSLTDVTISDSKRKREDDIE